MQTQIWQAVVDLDNQAVRGAKRVVKAPGLRRKRFRRPWNASGDGGRGTLFIVDDLNGQTKWRLGKGFPSECGVLGFCLARPRDSAFKVSRSVGSSKKKTKPKRRFQTDSVSWGKEEKRNRVAVWPATLLFGPYLGGMEPI